MKKNTRLDCIVCGKIGKIHAKSMCSSCYNKQYYASNVEYHKEKYAKWLIANRDFNRRRNKEWSFQNKDKRSEYYAEYYALNKENKRSTEKEWRSTENGRKKRAINQCKRNHRIRAKSDKSQDINIVIVKDAYKACVFCGSGNNLTLEHIIPICSGGDNGIDNLAMSCSVCNNSKGTKDMMDWLSRNDNLSVTEEILEKYKSAKARLSCS